MSISYLFNPNDYDLYARSLTASEQNITNVSTENITTENITASTNIITQELNFTNTEVHTVNLIYFTNVGSSYILLVPNIQIKTTLLDRFVYIEIPPISVFMPEGVEDELILSQSVSSETIPFPFEFKYETYQPGIMTQTIQSVVSYRVLTSNNSPIFIKKLDNSLFSGGNTVFNSTVLTYVRNALSFQD